MKLSFVYLAVTTLLSQKPTARFLLGSFTYTTRELDSFSITWPEAEPPPPGPSAMETSDRVEPLMLSSSAALGILCGPPTIAEMSPFSSDLYVTSDSTESSLWIDSRRPNAAPAGRTPSM